jgi:hypothetical protein
MRSSGGAQEASRPLFTYCFSILLRVIKGQSCFEVPLKGLDGFDVSQKAVEMNGLKCGQRNARNQWRISLWV